MKTRYLIIGGILATIVIGFCPLFISKIYGFPDGNNITNSNIDMIALIVAIFSAFLSIISTYVSIRAYIISKKALKQQIRGNYLTQNQLTVESSKEHKVKLIADFKKYVDKNEAFISVNNLLPGADYTGLPKDSMAVENLKGEAKIKFLHTFFIKDFKSLLNSTPGTGWAKMKQAIQNIPIDKSLTFNSIRAYSYLSFRIFNFTYSKIVATNDTDAQQGLQEILYERFWGDLSLEEKELIIFGSVIYYGKLLTNWPTQPTWETIKFFFKFIQEKDEAILEGVKNQFPIYRKIIDDFLTTQATNIKIPGS